MSGVWKHLVRSVKLALMAVLGGCLASEEILVTSLVEVENVLNSLPLCKSSDNPNDDEVLTPEQFLLQRGPLYLLPREFSLTRINITGKGGDKCKCCRIISGSDG